MEKFNIVIGTHGRFGEELVNSARMIAGALENVQCCSLLPRHRANIVKIKNGTENKISWL